MWLFSRKGPSGFSSSSTAEEVTQGINAAGLTAIVTGGSSGIGEETARVLALCGAHVILAVRNTAAGQTTKEKILKQTPTAKVDVMELDLSSIAVVKNFVSQFKSTGLPLNLLINNAGISMMPYNLSVDGIELQFATNYVGHFLLTHLLLDTMKETSHRSNVEGRIVNVTSTAHFTFYKEGICFEKINDEASYGRLSAYRVSKLANILHANELSRHLREEGVNVTANSLHPGLVVTKIVDHLLFRSSIINQLSKVHSLPNLKQFFSFDSEYVKRIPDLVTKDIHQASATTCYVALHPQVKGVSGKYFSNCNLSKPWPQATDMDLAKKLWDFTSNLIK